MRGGTKLRLSFKKDFPLALADSARKSSYLFHTFSLREGITYVHLDFRNKFDRIELTKFFRRLAKCVHHLPSFRQAGFNERRRRIKIAAFTRNRIISLKSSFHFFFRCQKGLFERIAIGQKGGQQRRKKTAGAMNLPVDSWLFPEKHHFSIKENINRLSLEVAALNHHCPRA